MNGNIATNYFLLSVIYYILLSISQVYYKEKEDSNFSNLFLYFESYFWPIGLLYRSGSFILKK